MDLSDLCLLWCGSRLGLRLLWRGRLLIFSRLRLRGHWLRWRLLILGRLRLRGHLLRRR